MAAKLVLYAAHYGDVVLTSNKHSCSICRVIYSAGTTMAQYTRFCPCCILLICMPCCKEHEECDVSHEQDSTALNECDKCRNRKLAYMRCDKNPELKKACQNDNKNEEKKNDG